MKVRLRFEVEVDPEGRNLPKFNRDLLDELSDEVSAALARKLEGMAVTGVRRSVL